jgi:ArsR family transcriptional regulator
VTAAQAPGSRRDGGQLQAWSEAVALLSAVADPIRLAILARLTGGSVHVGQLLEGIPVAPNLLSYHLKVLREAGLVRSARRGRRIDYRLNGDALERLHAAIPARPEEGVSRAR